MFGNFPIIDQPFGISVFGSALLRVSPDFATIQAAITRLEDKPSDAFAKARKAAHAVTEFLHKMPVKESGLSKISLSQQYRLFNSERQPIGYMARIGLTVVLNELEKIEQIVSGLVDAGTNEVTAIEFQTVKLKEFRARARELAVQAAREKAEIYAIAAKVTVGEVLHIQDVNPNVLRQETHVAGPRGPVRQEPADSEPDVNTLDPSAIQVGAAVMVAYRVADLGAARHLASLGGTMPEL
jgi:uncharacterized protein